MWLRIFYKEWLKTRWGIYTSLLLIAIMSVYVFLDIRQDIMEDTNTVTWYRLLFMKNFFYENFKIVSIINGLLLAILQYMPEISQKRLKLTLHLPISYRFAFFYMILYGVVVNVFFLVFADILFGSLLMVYFTASIGKTVLLSIIPWQLSGVISYGILSCVLLEKQWGKRLFIIVIGVVCVLVPLQASDHETMNPILFLWLCIAFLWQGALFYFGFRYSKLS